MDKRNFEDIDSLPPRKRFTQKLAHERAQSAHRAEVARLTTKMVNLRSRQAHTSIPILDRRRQEQLKLEELIASLDSEIDQTIRSLAVYVLNGTED